ncbi:MAG: isocitrate/isopropylmalate family dehydrogenase [Methanobacterium sp.]|nr:isocitrate/isopropylmalate family dehydrogenase [Methanobacterium sp.]
MYKIAVIPGDGIGKEVMEATLHVLDASDIEFEYIFTDAGDEYAKKTGIPLPQETIDIVKQSKACLFGAAGETAADVIVKLRRELDLYVNLRPVKAYPGIKSVPDNIDFVIVRENTEGLYSGIEEYIKDGATAVRIITNQASERICRYAFEYAKKTGRKKVTAVHKANVLKKTDGIFKDNFYKVAQDFTIETDDKYVDATAMFLITNPNMFDIIVTTNLFGDILSDEGAGLVGGLGLIPSANIGENQGLFEPVHGSAPNIAGKGIANPSAMILSAVMMLDYLDENKEARKLEKALITVLNDKKVVTMDLGGNATTMEMAAEIKAKYIEE